MLNFTSQVSDLLSLKDDSTYSDHVIKTDHVMFYLHVYNGADALL